MFTWNWTPLLRESAHGSASAHVAAEWISRLAMVSHRRKLMQAQEEETQAQFIASRLEAIASRLEAIAGKLEAIASTHIRACVRCLVRAATRTRNLPPCVGRCP